MKITIEQHELGFIYRIEQQQPYIRCVGLALSIGDALFEIAKTLAKQPNDQELSHRRLATSERRKSEANN